MKYARWALALVLIFTMTGGVAQAAKPESAKTPKEKVDAAFAKGKSGVKELLDSKPAPEVAQELLNRATITEGEGEYANAIASKRRNVPKAKMSVACQGAISRRITVGAAGVTLAWRQVRLAGWCWGGGRITDSWGSTYDDWNAFPYCWRNESRYDNWLYWPTVRYTANSGVLGVNYTLGCATSQTVRPVIHYRDGGSYYF